MIMIQLYDWVLPSDMIETQYGRITHKRWLRLEAARIMRDDDRVAEIIEEKRKDKKGIERTYIALFVDQVA